MTTDIHPSQPTRVTSPTSSLLIRSILPVLLVCMFILSPRADATPVTWTLAGATFDDGTAITGSFIYDADTFGYSSLAIQTADFIPVLLPTFGSNLYSPAHSITLSGTSATGFTVTDSTTSHALTLLFGTLTNIGTSVSLLTTSSETDNAVTDFFGNPTNPTRFFITGGTLTSSTEAAVPEPGSVALLGIALAFFGTLRQRRS